MARRTRRTFNVVGIHTAGETCDVVTGGFRDVPGTTMFEKMNYVWQQRDDLRQLLLQEPRGSSAMCANILMPPCNPEADAGFITMEHEEYPPMSGGNIIAVTTVLLETGMIPVAGATTTVKLDTGAGLVPVTAEIDESGKCTSVAFDNVPSFVFELDLEVNVPDLGPVKVDIAWGGMIYAVVDATTLPTPIALKNYNGAKLVELGERIKRAVQAKTSPVHPSNPDIRGVSILEFTEPMYTDGSGKTAVNTVVVSPGRLDRCPCGTGTCARLAIMHARGQIGVNESFRHRSIIGSEFFAHIRGTTKVGEYDAVLPTVKGSAWITEHKTVVCEPTDPFPLGFRVGDVWNMDPGEE